MENHFETIVTVTVFALFYLIFAIRETALQRIDLYDLMMLSTVAIFPWMFVVFPSQAMFLTNFFGVKFPFVIMFGAILVAIFIFVNRLTVKLHQLQKLNRELVQEVGILKERLNVYPGATN